MAKHYDKQFKLDAVQYYHDHKNLGISQQTLSRWQKELRETGDMKVVVPVTMLLMKQKKLHD